MVCNDDVLEIVLGLLDAVVPGERFAIAGTSYGGHLARAVIHRRLPQIDGAKGLFRALVGEWLDRVDEYGTGAAAQR